MDELTVVLVGAGALENAWPPVIRALPERVTTIDQANTWLASRVHLRRFWAQRLADTTLVSHQAPTRAAAAESEFNTLTDAVARELQAAEISRELTLRDSFYRTWEQHVHASKYITLVTTNWDRTLEAAAKAEKLNVAPEDVIHLHGDRRDPRRLYLPTEVVMEPYRTPEQQKALGKLQVAVTQKVVFAQRLVITGLAFTGLDAELTTTVAMAVDNSAIREVIVVDPCFETVTARLACLLNNKRNIRGYPPAT